ncbi:putative protease YdcP [termite gut metagenome]|uniref:Putative protease YdcP n=1 Tax=termite gut metagenome TaxID=433724 RepID=A0A5J4QDL7_9ZZZZ
MKLASFDFGSYPVFLAPMEDVTDAAFRLMCKKFGADMVYSEFISSDALIRSVNKTLRKLVISDEERPVAIQIYGKEKEVMAVSGKCYLSLHEMNSSANRGACMQVCRRAYAVRDKETGAEWEVDNQYIMSPKDLKTIHFINKMIDSGVRIFKIEGRARGPEYVRTVCECYKQAVQSYMKGVYTENKITAWNERLKKVFNRGFWDGYYLGQPLGEWSRNYGSEATERKVYVGKGITYFGNIGVAEFVAEAAELNAGDKILITGPTTGAIYITLEEVRVELKPVQTVKQHEHFSIKIKEKIRPSDKLFKMIPNRKNT